MKNHLLFKHASGRMKSILLLFMAFAFNVAFGQDRSITGTITDQQSNESLPGASVVVKGTTKGATTDLDGKFRLMLAPGENTLVISYIGYESQEVAVGNLQNIAIQLLPSKTSLEEVVVVGYGSAKVKDLTSSIATLKTEDLIKTPSSQPIQAMQGKVSGLQVVSNGGPGESPKVRIRGIGSYPGADGRKSNENPLYVVDGMFYDNIDFINPSDIASMSVLKDASAAAIYGVRAANGVVLIETKSGQYNQKVQVTYNGYAGIQFAQNVVKMANSQQYTQLARELDPELYPDYEFVLNAMQRYGRSRVNPNIPAPNTNWYAEILRPAPITNHSLDFSGGSDKARYSIGTNYFYQDGIMDTKNLYERLNFRSKIDLKATKWLMLGGSAIISNATKYTAPQGAWNEAYFAVPIMEVNDESNTTAWPTNYSNAKDLGYRSGQNPFTTIDNNIDRMKIKKLLTNFYAEITFIPKTLTFKTSYNFANDLIDQRVVNLPWFIATGYSVEHSKVTKTITDYTDQIWDNVLTLTKEYGDHNFTLMGGTSFKVDAESKLTASGTDFPYQAEEHWYLSLADVIDPLSVEDNGLRQYGFSYFGRLSYNYKDKYLLYGTFRADGSNKYQEKWGYFPTVGVGWVVTEEEFLKGNNILDYLKLRASWGQLGNNKVAASSGSYTTTVHNWPMGGIVMPGTVTSSSFAYLLWETTEETNVGFTARLIDNHLSAEFDYYIRDTKDAAIPVKTPGTGDFYDRTAGTIRNSGIELALDWNNKISDRFSYSVGGNFSTLKNEAVDLYGQSYIDGGTAEFLQRTYVGEPLNAFYGWEVAGVYQNTSEIEADPIAVANELEPGDFKYVDQNGDGVLDAEDRVILGSYFPTFMYGGYINIQYGAFDFSTNIYGQTGNKILNRRRGELIWTPDGNLDAELAEGRWHGDGTSNEFPSAQGLRKGWNQKMSDYFVQDGSFFRIQNVQIGYTIKDVNWFGGNFPETRIAFTAERPLTLFSYNGFTPEVDNGWDYQVYPIPAVYTINLNVKF
ncbi:MAG TPA: TonB-dependent receptor [Lentimicrobium sp.]|nr:TonB-dependent receptor [Lentimicrobium sp.]